MTSKGRFRSLKSLVVVGNQQGAAGFGVGKAQSVADATVRTSDHNDLLCSFYHMTEYSINLIRY